MLKSEELTSEDFASMIAGASVLGRDRHGIKVYLLQSGQILKIYRVKRIFSSARIYSYARYFCRNAERLQKLGIRTVTIEKLLYFSGSSNTAVLYRPLAGETLWDLLQAGKVDDRLIKRLGEYVARLHRMGIYFRSLHLGNVVLTEDGQLGLIDVSDMSIFPWALNNWQRLRNFRLFAKRDQGIKALTENQQQVFLAAYFDEASLSANRKVAVKIAAAIR
jgi:tRNA A-37 threonylcarbamoyl transferase component Bud32